MPGRAKCLLKRGQTILFDGDSLTSRRARPALDTWPYLRLMNWDRTYADELSGWLFCIRPDLRLTFVNVAVGGLCCRDLLERLETLVLPANPDWVIMTLGGNDAARGIPLREFTDRVTHYITRIADECGGRVVLLGGFRRCPPLPEIDRPTKARRRRYDLALRRIADRTGAIFLNVGPGLRTRARLLHKQSDHHTVYSDGPHFNVIANRIIAAELLEGLHVGRRPDSATTR